MKRLFLCLLLGRHVPDVQIFRVYCNDVWTMSLYAHAIVCRRCGRVL